MAVPDDRLYEFFVTDDRARWREFWISLGFGTVAGFVSIISGDSEPVFVSATLLAASICFGIRLWLYIRVAEHVQLHSTQITRRNWSLAACTGVVAVLTVIATRLKSKTEALVSQRIMGTLDASDPTEFLERAGVVVSQAKQSGVKANPKVVFEASQKVSKIIRSDQAIANSAVAWTTAGALVSYYSFVTVPNVPTLPKCADFSPFQTYPDPGPANEFTTLHNCTFFLDGNILRHAELTRCVIKYHGGPAELNDLRFIDCIFDISLRKRPESKAAEALIYALLVTGSQPVRFRYTPSSTQQ